MGSRAKDLRACPFVSRGAASVAGHGEVRGPSCSFGLGVPPIGNAVKTIWPG